MTTSTIDQLITDAIAMDKSFLTTEVEATTIPEKGSIAIADGQSYSPSWRKLSGGGHIFDKSYLLTEDEAIELIEGYEYELNKVTEELGLWWADGILWAGSDDDELPG